MGTGKRLETGLSFLTPEMRLPERTGGPRPRTGPRLARPRPGKAHLGAVGPLLPRLEDAAAAALAALVETLQPLQVDAQVQAVGQAALLRWLLTFRRTAAAAPAVTVAVRHGAAVARASSQPRRRRPHRTPSVLAAKRALTAAS